jgi:predicted kinase
MRKWMRERVKRRKSKGETASQPAESPQAPLQPAYFDQAESTPATLPAEVQPGIKDFSQEATPEIAEPMHSVSEPEQESTPASAAPSGTGPVRRRRRRGRGGRGRGKEGQATPQPLVAQPESGTKETVAAETPVPAEVPRAAKGAVVLAVGLPGSGKSSWFKRHKISPLSSDLLRALLFDDPKEQRFQDLVFSNLRSMLKARLIARRPISYVDATNLSPHERHTWMKMAREYGYEVHAVYFDVPVEVCMERNRRRERNVPEDVMRRMAAKLRPPAFEEGFTKITVVRVKKKEEGAGKQEDGLPEQKPSDQ